MTSARRNFFTSVDWAALASHSGDGCDIRVVALCTLGNAVSEFFDQLGVAFKPAKSDVSGNVKKMADGAKLLDSAAQSSEFDRRTIGDLIQREQSSGVAFKDPSGTIGILWFKRALEYLYALLCLVSASRSRTVDFGMSGLCHRAYEATLKPRHSWIVQKTFGLVISAAPKRSQFLIRAAYGDANYDESELYASMTNSLVSMQAMLQCLNAALCRLGVEAPPLPDLEALAALRSQ